MPFTTVGNVALLDAFAQAASLGGPATHHIGLFTGTTWVASHAYTSGAYVIPTTFNSISGDIGKIFKCTTSGTSNTTEPTWPTTAGGTVTDNTAHWTEVALLFQAGTITGAEMTGTSYARPAVTANSTNFPNASSAEPSVSQNGTAINFATPGSDWGLAIGFGFFDSATTGVLWNWGATTSALDCSNGSSPSFGIDTLSLSLQAA